MKPINHSSYQKSSKAIGLYPDHLLTSTCLSCRDPDFELALTPIFIQARKEGSTGHLSDYDRMVKIKRLADDLATSQAVCPRFHRDPWSRQKQL